ncbi:hypothetical protein TUMEXPCC7403_24365 [Tumidithrix helvetica PCC 7403]|uniref:hypothetical protein n=1 Tax=Tumidithrix helvetica TaxID=3457545 RepID=UPI003CBFB017
MQTSEVGVTKAANLSLFMVIPISLEFATDRGLSSAQSAVFSKRCVASFFENGMSLSHRLLQDFRHTNQELSILDLKAGFRGFKYVQEVLKLLPQKPDPILLASIFTNVANLGAIHPIPSFADTL